LPLTTLVHITHLLTKKHRCLSDVLFFISSVQALVSQGISITLNKAFATLSANQRIVSPQFCGSNLRISKSLR
jgi:hypothetical protein